MHSSKSMFSCTKTALKYSAVLSLTAKVQTCFRQRLLTSRFYNCTLPSPCAWLFTKKQTLAYGMYSCSMQSAWHNHRSVLFRTFNLILFSLPTPCDMKKFYLFTLLCNLQPYLCISAFIALWTSAYISNQIHPLLTNV